MTITITPAHLDAALAVPWSTTTCIWAQAVASATNEKVKLCGQSSVQTSANTFYYPQKNSDKLSRIMSLFDSCHGPVEFNTGQTHDEKLIGIRAALPLEVEVTVTKFNDL